MISAVGLLAGRVHAYTILAFLPLAQSFGDRAEDALAVPGHAIVELTEGSEALPRVLGV